MRKNRGIRKQARNTVKKNYFTLVFICFIMMFLAGNYNTSMTGIKNIIRMDFVIEFNSSYNPDIRLDYLTDTNSDITSDVLNEIFHTDDIEKIKFKESVTGGIFRTIFDGITHAERVIFKILKFLMDLFVNAKQTVALSIIIILIQFLYGVLFKNH